MVNICNFSTLSHMTIRRSPLVASGSEFSVPNTVTEHFSMVKKRSSLSHHLIFPLFFIPYEIITNRSTQKKRLVMINCPAFFSDPVTAKYLAL